MWSALLACLFAVSLALAAPAGASPPGRPAVRVLDPVHWQPAGHHDEIMGLLFSRRHRLNDNNPARPDSKSVLSWA